MIDNHRRMMESYQAKMYYCNVVTSYCHLLTGIFPRACEFPRGVAREREAKSQEAVDNDRRMMESYQKLLDDHRSEKPNPNRNPIPHGLTEMFLQFAEFTAYLNSR